jgi:DNA repair exonuclease SbcCD ATPase subunit
LNKRYENQLNKLKVKLNDIQTHNSKLRGEVDVLRKEHKNQVRVNVGLDKEIVKIVTRAKDLSIGGYTEGRKADGTHNQILALKKKHEDEKESFEKKIKDLQDQLKERDESELDHSRTKDMSNSKKIDLNAASFSNPAQLLKERLKKKTANNKEKKNLMDMYVRNVRVIEDAFEQIKEATGISSIEEIVTTFIKAEDQNNSLINYVNVFNSDIDMINEQNETIRQEIEMHERAGAMGEQEKEKLKAEMNAQIGDIKNKIEDKDGQITVMEQEMSNIKDFVRTMVGDFNKSKFFLSVAQNMHYDEETQFNEGNVTMYLGELEEYIS